MACRLGARGIALVRVAAPRSARTANRPIQPRISSDFPLWTVKRPHVAAQAVYSVLTMRLHWLLLALLAVPTTSTPQRPAARPEQPSGSAPAADPTGQTATDVADHIHCVFQSKDAAYWFGSNDQGIYRLRGVGKDQVLQRFTTEHGLAGDSVRNIQEDAAGNLLVFCDPGGVSRFDGRKFHTLTPLEPPMSEWKLAPDDLWFPGGQDSGAVYRWDGASLHKLVFPATEAGDAHLAAFPRAK